MIASLNNNEVHQQKRRKVMGFYVNPASESKESFLHQNGVIVPNTFKFADLSQGKLPVILVDNGPFTAAAIAYSERELQAFTNPSDTRTRTTYIVDIEKILEVAGDDFLQYAKQNNMVAA